MLNKANKLPDRLHGPDKANHRAVQSRATDTDAFCNAQFTAERVSEHALKKLYNSLANCYKCSVNTFTSALQSTSCENCASHTYSSEGYSHCVACKDENNVPVNGEIHPFFVLDGISTPSTCYFECPDDYTADSHTQTCAKESSGTNYTGIYIAIAVCLVVALIAGTSLYFYCRKRTDPSTNQGTTDAGSDRIDIKVEDKGVAKSVSKAKTKKDTANAKSKNAGSKTKSQKPK